MILGLVILFEVLNMGDFVTTLIALRLGAQEGNPLVARWPRLAYAMKLGGMVVVAVFYRAFHGVSLWVLIAVTLEVALVVLGNVRVCMNEAQANRTVKP